eukprot:scaffold7942_cov111-Cylindrotheca_fusiformis.AAC.2
MTHSGKNHTSSSSSNETCYDEFPEGGDCSDGVCRWLTIPYAKPMSKRFKKSEPLEDFGGPNISKANDGYGPVCVQWFPNLKLEQSENCLTLNIWAPDEDEVACDDKKPVMVWIHGGGFLEGGGATSLAAYGFKGDPEVKLYDGANLVSRHDVVVVVIQYRLGPFGFLAPGGSNGLGDQISALQWIKKHIARFGGDSKSVTLFGQSSGSVSICALMHTPSTEGLFHRAILQSGSCYPSIDVLVPKKDGLTIRQNYLDSLYNSSKGELDIKTAPVEEILNHTFGVYNNDWVKIFLAGLGAPSVDGDILPNLPYRVTPHEGIDVLAGTTSFDQTVNEIRSGREEFLKSFGVESSMGLSYDGDDDANLFMDACLRCQSQRFLEQIVDEGGGTGYWYTYDCPHDEAPHGSDMLGVLGNIDSGLFESGTVRSFIGTRPSDALIERVQDIWVSFASTGDPGWDNATGAGMGAIIGCDETTTHSAIDMFGTCDDWTSAADDLGSLKVSSICMQNLHLDPKQQQQQKQEDEKTQSSRARPLGVLLPLAIAVTLACAVYCARRKKPRSGYSLLQ